MRHAMNSLGLMIGVVMLALGAPGTAAMAGDVELSFYYPVAVGGPITKIVDGYAAEFTKQNPGIKINAIYAGTYQDTLVKTLTAFNSGEPPDVAVLLSTDMYTLIDEDAIMPFDDLLNGDADKAWVKSFFPAFMENSQTGGKTWDEGLWNPVSIQPFLANLSARLNEQYRLTFAGSGKPGLQPVRIRTEAPGVKLVAAGKT